MTMYSHSIRAACSEKRVSGQRDCKTFDQELPHPPTASIHDSCLTLMLPSEIESFSFSVTMASSSFLFSLSVFSGVCRGLPRRACCFAGSVGAVVGWFLIPSTAVRPLSLLLCLCPGEAILRAGLESADWVLRGRRTDSDAYRCWGWYRVSAVEEDCKDLLLRWSSKVAGYQWDAGRVLEYV